MSNRHKGEVSFEAEGVTYVLRFSIDALCRLEDTSGLVLSDLLEEMSDKSRMTIRRVRQLLHAALLEHHPELDLQAAGELMLKGGGVLATMARVTEAMSAAFPEASGKPRPPEPPATPANRAERRRAGSGKRS